MPAAALGGGHRAQPPQALRRDLAHSHWDHSHWDHSRMSVGTEQKEAPK